jgi:RNA-directed DNA polymerase
LDNRTSAGYVFKADIRHYFENIDHQILLKLIRKRIKDAKTMWLIETILKNHKTLIPGKGMPLGNLTSQFFANLYLNELDYFVKHKLKAKYYIRYVDDFVILHKNKRLLKNWKKRTNNFLKHKLKLELHPEKSKIFALKRGITFLGFRIFSKHRLLKKSNTRRIRKRLGKFKQKFQSGNMEKEKISQSLDGWIAYAEFANTYNLRMKVASAFAEAFNTEEIAN